eukprot:scaffold790_cov387-Prasinococcus_capsulatus_cf.AAC.13
MRAELPRSGAAFLRAIHGRNRRLRRISPNGDRNKTRAVTLTLCCGGRRQHPSATTRSRRRLGPGHTMNSRGGAAPRRSLGGVDFSLQLRPQQWWAVSFMWALQVAIAAVYPSLDVPGPSRILAPVR